MTPAGFVLSTGTRKDGGPVVLAADRPFEHGDVLTITTLDRDIVFMVRIVEDGIRVEAIDPEAPAWNEDAVHVNNPVEPNIEFTYP